MSENCPYPGLRPFRHDEGGFFFGRENHSRTLRERLAAQRFLAVIGTSGSGKSSLVRAGLLADSLEACDRAPSGATGGGEVTDARAGSDAGDRMPWRVAEFRPGRGPFSALAGALAEALKPERRRQFDEDLEEEKVAAVLAADTAYLEATLRDNLRGIREVLVDTFSTAELLEAQTLESGWQTAAAGETTTAATVSAPGIAFPPGFQLLIFVDQFEEIFRYRREGSVFGGAAATAQWLQGEADEFVAALLSVVQDESLPVKVLITMRSDYLGDCAIFQGLPELIDVSQYLIPRLTRPERTAAIVGPARLAGGDIEPELTNRLLNDSGPDQDQLPLLQHCLMRLWAFASERARPNGIAAETASRDGSEAPPPESVAPIAAGAETAAEPAHEGRTAESEPLIERLKPAEAWPDLTVDDYLMRTGALHGRRDDGSSAPGGPENKPNDPLAERLLERNCVSRHAAEVLGSLERAGVPERTVAMLFRALTYRASGGRDTRREMTFGEASQIVVGPQEDKVARGHLESIVKSFAADRCNFITLQPRELSDSTIIDISHESLQRNWDRLRDEWLPAEKRDAEAYLAQVRDARAWANAGRREPLTGRLYREAQAWWSDFKPTPAWAVMYAAETAGKTKQASGAADYKLTEEFLEASRLAEQDRVVKDRRSETLTTTLGAVAILAGILVVALLFLSGKIKESARRAKEADGKITHANETIKQAEITRTQAQQAEAKAQQAVKEATASLQNATIKAAKAEKDATDAKRESAGAMGEKAQSAWGRDELLSAIARLKKVQDEDPGLHLHPTAFVPPTKYPPYVFDRLFNAGHDIRGVVFDPSGQFLAVSFGSGELKIFNLALAGGEAKPVVIPADVKPGEFLDSKRFAFVPGADNDRVNIALLSDRSVRVFSAGKGDLMPSPFAMDENVLLRPASLLAFDWAHNRMVVVQDDGAAIIRQNGKDKTVIQPDGRQGKTNGILFFEDSTNIAIATDNGLLLLNPDKAGETKSLWGQAQRLASAPLGLASGPVNPALAAQFNFLVLNPDGISTVKWDGTFSAKHGPQWNVATGSQGVAAGAGGVPVNSGSGQGLRPPNLPNSSPAAPLELLTTPDGRYFVWSPTPGYFCVSNRLLDTADNSTPPGGSNAPPTSVFSDTLMILADSHRLTALAINPANMTIVTAGSDGLLRFWKRVTEDEARDELAKNAPPIMGLSVGAGGQPIGFGIERGRMRALTTEAGKSKVIAGPEAMGESLDLSEDSAMLFGGQAHATGVWNPLEDKVSYGLSGFAYELEPVLPAVNLEQSLFAVANRATGKDGQVSLIDFLTGALYGTARTSPGISMLGFSPKADRLVVLCDRAESDAGISANASSGDLVNLPRKGAVTVMLASANEGGQLWRLAEPPDPTVLRVVSHEYLPAPALGAGGYEKWVFQAIGPGDVEVKMWYGVARPAPTSNDRKYNFVVSVSAEEDAKIPNKTLEVSDILKAEEEETEKPNKTLEVWDISDRAAPKRIKEPQDCFIPDPKASGDLSASILSVSDDAKRIALRAADGVRVFDLTQDKIRDLKAQDETESAVDSFALERGGKRIALAFSDRSIVVRDLDEGKEVAAWSDTRKVEAMTFAPDGSLFYAGDDRVIYRGRAGQKECQWEASGSWFETPRTALSQLAGCLVDNGIVRPLLREEAPESEGLPKAALPAEAKFWPRSRALERALANESAGKDLKAPANAAASRRQLITAGSRIADVSKIVESTDADSLNALLNLPKGGAELRARVIAEKSRLLAPTLRDLTRMALSGLTFQNEPGAKSVVADVLKLDPHFDLARVLGAYLDGAQSDSTPPLSDWDARRRRILGQKWAELGFPDFFTDSDMDIPVRAATTSPDSMMSQPSIDFAAWLAGKNFISSDLLIKPRALLAFVLFGNGDYKGAADQVTKTIQTADYAAPLVPKLNTQLLLLRGRAYRKSDRRDLAQKDFESVAAIEPSMDDDSKAIALTLLGRPIDSAAIKSGAITPLAQITMKRILAATEVDSKKRAALEAEIRKSLALDYSFPPGLSLADYLRGTRDLDSIEKDQRLQEILRQKKSNEKKVGGLLPFD